MSVGKLNRKLFFQTQSRTSDGGGSQSVAFYDSFSTFGSIQPKRGQETQFGDQLEERITHIITIRFRTNVSHKLRIQYRPETGTTRTFNIKRVLSKDDRKRYLDIMVIEGVAT